MMKKHFFIITAFLLFSAKGYSQFGSSGIPDAHSAGLSGTYNTLNTGSYSIGINPANILMQPYKGDLIFLFPLPQVHFRAGNDAMTLDDVNYFFGGINGDARFLTDADVDRLYSLFEGGSDFQFGITANLVSFTINIRNAGAFGFSINDVAAGSFHIPQELAELPLKGNLIGQVYSFNDANFKSWWLRSYSLSYARELDVFKRNFSKVTAGVTLKLLHGYFYAGTEEVNSFITFGDQSALTGRADYLAYTSFSQDIGIRYSFDKLDKTGTNAQVFPAPAGTGFGADFGVAAKLKNWNFAFSLTDIGSISWKKRTAKFLAEGDIYFDDLTDETQRDSLVDQVTKTGNYIDGFSTGLPFAIRTGASYLLNDDKDAIPGNLLLAADYNQGFNDLPGNTTTPRFSVAGDWQPADWSSIKMGFSFGGLDGFNWSAGLGFQSGVLELNIATTDMLTLPAPNSTRQISFAVNSRWRFK